MNGKVFDENNQLIAQYFDVSVEIDYKVGRVYLYSKNGIDGSLMCYDFKKILISQDEKEIIVYK